MSEALHEFRLANAASVAEACAALAAEPQARLVAGGTDLVTNLRRGLVDAPVLVDVSRIAEMRTIDPADGGGLDIGAAVTLRELCENETLGARFPAIVEAARTIAGPAHRETGTLGGNLCLDTRCLYYNQSEWWRRSNDYCLKYRGTVCHVAPRGDQCRAAYSGDLAPALIVTGAEVSVASGEGTRRMPVAALFNDDGRDYLTLSPGEMVTAIHLPPPGGTSGYEKLRVRGAIDFPLAGVAAQLSEADAAGTRSLRLGFTGVAPAPVALDPIDLADGEAQREQAFTEAEKAIKRAVTPQRTTTIAPHYRRLAISALALRLMRRLL